MVRIVARAGVSGRRQMVAEVTVASGMVWWLVVRRHGVVPAKLLGDIVSVIAWDSRK